MKKWVLKAIVQKMISFLPYRERVNHLFQKHVTKGLILDDTHLGYKVEHARDHLRFLRKFGKADQGLQVLELGTGWYPIIPICFWLEGVGQVLSVDLSSWMTLDTQMTAVIRLLEWRTKGRLKGFIAGDEEKWSTLEKVASGEHPLESAKDFEALIGLTSWVGDARSLPLNDASIDFITSNNTFEHIYPDVLKDILNEFKRVQKPDGLMSHFIDMSDHFAHFDQSITIYNFLGFSERQWNWIDNSIQPQNRWRWTQYIQLYRELGIEILHEEVREGDPEALGRVSVHPEWARYSNDALAISHGYIISR